jgi:hypothetical protein
MVAGLGSKVHLMVAGLGSEVYLMVAGLGSGVYLVQRDGHLPPVLLFLGRGLRETSFGDWSPRPRANLTP